MSWDIECASAYSGNIAKPCKSSLSLGFVYVKTLKYASIEVKIFTKGMMTVPRKRVVADGPMIEYNTRVTEALRFWALPTCL